MARLYLCVTQQHDLSLVLLAAIVCLMASFAALSLINRAIGNEGTGRLVWLGVGATVSAAGIWATHFIAMLAFDTGLPTGYDIGLTILSLLIAIVITALGFALATYRRTSSGALMGGAIVGAGISAMHFTGMAGLLVPATMAWSYGLVAAAWMSGCGFAAFALRRAVVDASMSSRILGALQLTMAICSMHFTGMAALELTPDPLVPLPDAYLTADSLAINIALATLVIMALGTSGALVDQHLAGRRILEAERLRCLVNATFEGIGICVDGRLIETNSALAELLRTPKAALIDQPLARFVDPAHGSAVAGKLMRRQQEVMELPLVAGPGPAVLAKLMIRPINYDGRSAVVVAVRDITAERAAQAKLENDRDHLERVVAERTAELQSQAGRLAEALEEERKLAGLQRQFVAMVSHEFRTPLAIIDGHAQRILRRSDASLPERVQGRLVKIRHTVTRLIELMESVLAAARLEDGRIIFSPGPCALADLIAEVAAGYGDLNPDYKIILDLDQLPESITADGKLLRQVFSNLISNGIKYSPGGSHLWIHGRVDEAGDMVVTVRDEGVGIPAAEQEQLFERFFRASTSSGIAGSGIGLHLASHLVHMHDGVIDVDSIEGEGTTFRVRLPTRPGPAPIADEPRTAPSMPAPLAPQPSSMLQAS